jgi:transposase-like protein
VVCDGLKGLPEAITTVRDRAIVQPCVIHLLRNTFRYASRKCWDQIAKDIRPVYTAPTEAAAKERFTEFTAHWGAQYPAIIRLWENAWSEFVPLLEYDVEIRRVICSTNPVESLNAYYRRAIRARRHFPTERAAMKCLYLVTHSLAAFCSWRSLESSIRALEATQPNWIREQSVLATQTFGSAHSPGNNGFPYIHAAAWVLLKRSRSGKQ